MSNAGVAGRSRTSLDIRREVVEAQATRILASPVFRRAGNLAVLLRFIVDRTLAGDRAALKEYCLAVEVFRRAEDFDPKDFALVRVQATRLRRKLEQYYRTLGTSDSVVISVPKGGYAAHFEQRPGRSSHLGVELGFSPDISLVPDDRNADVCVTRASRLLDQWNEMSLARGAAMCRSAIRGGISDPRLPGLLALHLLGLYWYDQLPPDSIVPAAREAATEALWTSPVEARLVLCYIAWMHDRDRAAARRHLQAAVQADSGHEWAAALEELRRLCAGGELQRPSSVEFRQIVPPFDFSSSDPALSLGHSRVAAALDAHSPYLQWRLGACLIGTGDLASAQESLLRATSLGGAGTLASSSLAFVQARVGRTADASNWIARFCGHGARGYVSGIDAARVYAGLGDEEAAIAQLQAADRLRSGRMYSALLAPEFVELRHRRSFRAVMRAFCESCAVETNAIA